MAPSASIISNAGTETFNDTITAPAAGSFWLAIYSGDDAGARVNSGSVVVNGTTIVGPNDFAPLPGHVFRGVKLLAGANTLVVTIDGNVGSFLTLYIYSQAPVDAVVGRVLVPWANANNLVLDLKNAAANYDRSVRVVFYDASGAPVAHSNKIVLAPSQPLPDGGQPHRQRIVDGRIDRGRLPRPRARARFRPGLDHRRHHRSGQRRDPPPRRIPAPRTRAVNPFGTSCSRPRRRRGGAFPLGMSLTRLASAP